MKLVLNEDLNKFEILFIILPEKNWEKLYGSEIKTALKKEIKQLFEDKLFSGKLNENINLCSKFSEISQIILVGAGKLEELDDIRKIAGTIIKKAKKLKKSKLAIQAPKNLDIKRIISGIILGNYKFKIGDKKDFFTPKKVNIISNDKITKNMLKDEINLAESQNLIRDLVNLPSNLMTPSILEEEAKKISKGLKNPLKFKSLGEKEMLKLGMGSLLSVGQGSKEESKLIIFEYFGGDKKDAPIAFVGKGVCFDSGGYNVKPTGHIEDMKTDMAGAATVLGLFNWIKTAKPQKNIIGVMGVVENLINGEAFKPGDIITAMNGDTIEITNTDAEGRLVLADALYYVNTKYKPAKIIDMATLTGACIVALGNEITGIMGNNKKLIQTISKCAEKNDELVWELPITKLFRKKIKGEIADLVNWTAGVSAGSSMAGAFLENFVGKTPWLHIDMAGTAYNGKYGNAYTQKGATGVMLRTLKSFIQTE